MRKIGLFLLVFFFWQVLQAQNFKALFLGNSYTNNNNLPNLVSNIANGKGDTLSVDKNTPGGYTLNGHSTNQTSINKINSEDWDFVVLQEQSQLPSFPDWQVQQDVFPYAADLDSMIEDNNICTETVFFMTWGRKNGDQSNCANFPPLCTYEGMQERLRNAYLQMGTDNEATVSPVGMAFSNHIQRDTADLLNLYSGDNSHPSYAGSYLAACTFYATLFRKSPVGSTFFGNLDSATATYLQGIAAETVLDSTDLWRIGANDVVAGFDWEEYEGMTPLSNLSSNADEFIWYLPFGDTSFLPEPVITFVPAQVGLYEVTLIASSECGSDTTVQMVVLGVESIKELQLSFQVYPNPNNGLFKLQFDQALTKSLQTEIRDMQGKLVASKEISGNHVFDLRHLARGQYLLVLQNEEGRSVRKLVLE